MFDLDGEGAVFGDDVPAVFHVFDAGFAGTEDGFDGDGHAGFEDEVRGVGFEIRNGGVFVEHLANIVTGEFADNTEAVSFDDVLDEAGDFTNGKVGSEEIYG